MRLVQQQIIKPSNKHYKDIIDLCHKSKNLFNATLFEVRQYFFNEKKYLSYNAVDKLFKENNNPDYRSLPIQVAQQTMRVVDSEFRSFFRLLNKKRTNMYGKKISIPHYKDRDGLFMLIYTNQQLSHKELKKGIIKLAKSDIQFNTNVNNIQQVRFIPGSGYVMMEVVYNAIEEDLKQDNNRYMSIDLGVNNLATVTSNVIEPYIINGKPVKSINQYYNKKKAYLQSGLRNRRTSKLISSLTLKRNNKIKDYFHKSTRYIVNQAVFNSINTIVIGKNKDWKQDINMGTKNNQSFTFIPHSSFIDMLSYKCRLKGINVIICDEAYTSKSSFLDKDPIPELKCVSVPTFSGSRINRGTYRSGTGSLINADVNGSFNIMRKAVGDVVLPADRGFVFNPVRINF